MGVVSLGGQIYTVANYDRRTVLMDHYMRACIVEIGLDRALPQPGESDALYQARLHLLATSSLKVPQLLAGYLLPGSATEADWTPAMAEKTAAAIGVLDTEADRNNVDAMVMEVSFAFFQHAVGRLKSFPNFFPTTATPTQTPHSAHESGPGSTAVN